MVGGVASVAGSAIKNNAAKKQADQQYKNDMRAMELQRKWDIEDRDEARSYNRSELDEARAYDRAQLEESRAYSRKVVGQLVEDAEAAGFNPLTLLRNGGASGYNSGYGSASSFAPLSSTPLSRKAPVKQAVGGSPLGDAVDAFGDFMADFDPFADQKREQEYRLVESQIAALNAGALSGAPRGAASFAQGDVERRPSGGAGALSKANGPGEGKLVGGDDPTVSSLGWNDGDYGWFHSPWMTDGETVSTVYGDSEVLNMAYGAVKLGFDGLYSAGRNAWSAYQDMWNKPRRSTKVDPQYRDEYRRNIRESVPSLAR